jgi:acyl-CoA synthetase (AMP-forming)/AMP-acid ligase II
MHSVVVIAATYAGYKKVLTADEPMELNKVLVTVARVTAGVTVVVVATICWEPLVVTATDSVVPTE